MYLVFSRMPGENYVAGSGLSSYKTTLKQQLNGENEM